MIYLCIFTIRFKKNIYLTSEGFSFNKLYMVQYGKFIEKCKTDTSIKFTVLNCVIPQIFIQIQIGNVKRIFFLHSVHLVLMYIYNLS